MTASRGTSLMPRKKDSADEPAWVPSLELPTGEVFRGKFLAETAELKALFRGAGQLGQEANDEPSEDERPGDRPA